ncbi:hypothetical protein BH23VER1_BH23VER1_18500 [soil metagenome]
MLPAIVIIFSVIAFRLAATVFGGETGAFLSNFSPMGALVLCGAAFLPRRWALVIPFSALLVSDMLLNLHYGVLPITGTTAGLVVAFGLVAAVGWQLRGRGSFALLLGATVLGAVVFYLVTNTVSFFVSPVYPPTVAGWWQCLTVGVPGFPPTYLFFRNSLVSDLLFTGLFLACVRPFADPQRAGAGRVAPSSSSTLLPH